MILYNTGDILEVQVIGSIYGEQMMNVLHFENRGGQLDASGVATKMNTNWCGGLRQTYVPEWKWTMYKMRRVGPNDITEYETWPSNQTVGLASAGAFPLQIASLWNKSVKQTLPLSKGGRIYHPALSRGYWLDGTYTSVGLTKLLSDLADIKTKFLGTSATSGFRMVIRQKFANSSAFIPVDDLKFRMQPGVIRSRRPQW